jgi:hypothetical protein
MAGPYLHDKHHLTILQSQAKAAVIPLFSQAILDFSGKLWRKGMLRQSFSLVYSKPISLKVRSQILHHKPDGIGERSKTATTRAWLWPVGGWVTPMHRRSHVEIEVV